MNAMSVPDPSQVPGCQPGSVPLVLTVRFSMLAAVAHAGADEVSELLADAAHLVNEADGTERDAVAAIQADLPEGDRAARVLEEAVQVIARYLPEPGAAARQCSAYLGYLANRIRRESGG